MPETISHLILNVDDNEIGRYTKSRLLRHAGFTVIEAVNGKQALELTREQRPVLVLLDVKLPDISGLDVCTQIKRDHPEIFVLQISASRVTEGDRVRGLEGGADAYLTQPIAGVELVASINALLRIRVAEHALRASEAHLQGVLASATDYAIIRLNEDGRVTGWNAGAQAIFGWTEQEALQREVDFLFTEEDRQRQIPDAERQGAIANGRADDRRWMLRKSGAQFYAAGVMTRLSPPAEPGFLKILGDQTAQFEAEQAVHELNATLESRVVERTRDLEAANQRLLTEIEERGRAEEKLRQREKMDAIGQLTGGIAHDFNNMLSVVISGIGLIERRLARGQTDVKKYTQGVLESAHRAAELTKGLLAFSRQQPLSPEPIDVAKLVTRLTDLLARTLGENIKIQTLLPSDIWPTKVDASALESSILNLSVNARDAMENGGKLTIEAANTEIDEEYAIENLVTPGQYVLLAVGDTGSGMPKDVLAKAFDPFFTTKAVGKGTGLGLSQVFGFVRQSNGHIRIQTELGAGTTVKIYLPRYVGTNGIGVIEAKSSGKAAKPGEVVLLVEDEERVRLMAFDALKELGYTVVTAAQGGEALRIIGGDHKIDLLLTDVVMPGMPGSELAAKAIKIRPGLRVLFTTGYSPDATLNSGALGPNASILQKPFNIDQLAHKVRNALDV